MTFFFLKHGATLTFKVMRGRRYSFDLPQGGMEIPAEFIYKSEKKELIDQMKEKTLDEISMTREEKKGRKIVWKKRKIKIKNKKNFVCIFFPPI